MTHLLSAAAPVTTSSPREIDTLVRDHLPLVGYLVRDVAQRVPSHVNRDDLTSAAMAALAGAAHSFDPDQGVPFGSFATIRIRGALIDELRSLDWASRSVRGKARDLDAARNELTQRLGAAPSRAQLARTPVTTASSPNG